MPLILVVDDNSENRYMLEVLLGSNGFETVSAANGEEALATVRSRRPDLIVADILMPVMDGFTLCKRLKSEPEFAAIPFVFYTATYTEPKDMELGLSLGADRFLIKPLDIDELLRAFRELLRTRKADGHDVVERGLPEEMDLLKRYNEALFHKLEKKMADLEAANEFLREEMKRREATEAALRESEQTLQNLLDTLPIGLAWGDEHDGIRYVNDRFRELFGYGVAELTTVDDLLRQAQPDPMERKPPSVSWTEAIENARGADGPTPHFELRMPCKDGSFRDLAVAGAVVGTIHIAIFTDITEQKHLLAQLLQAQRLESIGNLAGGIAHDFNNILTTVTGFAGLLQMKMQDSDPSLTYVNEMAQAGVRGAALTHQLLAFGRQQILDVQTLDFNAAIASLQSMLLRLIREDISLSFVPFSGPLYVLADVNQIGQVVINLVTNARDAMPEGGSVTVSTGPAKVDDDLVKRLGYGEKGAYALLSVSDTGVGMTAETRERVFEPFFTTKEPGKGTGLGLAVVYGIVRQHKGMVEVTTEPGKGTRFDVYLPLLKRQVSTEELVKTEPRSWVGGAETILIAEDDDTIRTLAGEILTGRGYTVFLARDGEEAVSIAREQADKIQLVVLDLVMPKKLGFDAYLEISGQTPGVSVLFVTGYSEDEVESGEIRRRSLPLLMKPYTPVILLNKVREVLDKTRA